MKPPSGFDDHLSRREAARVLGYASEFKVRLLEREGRLKPVRGALRSAWYPRVQVEAVARSLARAPVPVRSDRRLGRWTDAALLDHLRGRDGPDGATGRARTVVDLVVEAGIPIARAERVYRFWLAHDVHPAAVAARAQRAAGSKRPAPADRAPSPAERRSAERREHDALLEQIRDPDPGVRAQAFAKLKQKRPF